MGNHPRNRSAFTLTELMVVIGIVLLLMGLAVPAFSLISGRTSIESAENQISAMLGRARASAIGLGRKQGIMFVHDRRNDRIAIAEVFGTTGPPTPAPGVDVYLDLVPDREFIYLPPNVSVQTVTNCDMNTSVTPNVRVDDAYIGFNYGSDPTIAPLPPFAVNSYGGVILFDANGRLISQRYAFRLTTSPVAPEWTFIAEMLFDNGQGEYPDILALPTPIHDIIPPTPPTSDRLRSQVGLVLFDRSAYENVNGTEEYPIWTGPTDRRRTVPDWEITGRPMLGMATYDTNWTATGRSELQEEEWLDDNAVPLLVNRYNGTLMRGE